MDLKTREVIKAFKKIKRKDFLPDGAKNFSELDQALPIGFGQTISQPSVVAFMLELLQPQPEDTVLDVGAGRGGRALCWLVLCDMWWQLKLCRSCGHLEKTMFQNTVLLKKALWNSDAETAQKGLKISRHMIKYWYQHQVQRAI